MLGIITCMQRSKIRATQSEFSVSKQPPIISISLIKFHFIHSQTHSNNFSQKPLQVLHAFYFKISLKTLQKQEQWPLKCFNSCYLDFKTMIHTLVEKSSFAAVFWPRYAAFLTCSTCASSRCQLLNDAVQNRNRKHHYMLRF